MMHRAPPPRRRRNRVFPIALLLAGAVAASAAGIPTVPVKHLFDITTGDLGALALPSDVAVSSDGRIYIVDSGHHRVAAFDRAGKPRFSVGRQGTGPGEFRNPVGIGVDANGWFYVADKDNHRLQVFDADGAFQRAIALSAQGRPASPVDTAIDAQGRMYVSTTNHRVLLLDRGGKLLRHWGGEGSNNGEFRYPAGIAVDRRGLVHVVDVLNTRVQLFDPGGKWIINVGEWGVLPGQLFRPKGVALDARGRVYVADSYLDVVQVFDEARRFVHVLGYEGKPQRFVSAGGIAVDEANRLYVAEMLRHKISVYELP